LRKSIENKFSITAFLTSSLKCHI